MTACAAGRRAGTLAAVVVLAVASAAAAAPRRPSLYRAACQGTLLASTAGTVANRGVAELSGIAASRRNPGVWWVHNDSGDTARVFAVGDDGRDLGTFALANAAAVDWEDIAVGPGPDPNVSYLYVGDIGDNAETRASVVVYRVPEPAVGAQAAAPPPQTLTGVDALRFTYPDGPQDAEALMVDPRSGSLFVVSKNVSGSARVYRAPPALAAGSATELTHVATLSLGLFQPVTAADISPAGDVIAIRTYLEVLLYRRTRRASVRDALAGSSCRGVTAPERQGEAIAFSADGRGYVTASEGASPALHEFRAP